MGDRSTVSNLDALIFRPGEYLIVCSSGSEFAFSAFGKSQGQSSFPSLGNTNDELLLFDPSGNLIDQVAYEKSWYQSAVKEDGGFSLEQINPTLPCTGKFNFRASNSSNGGTPGQANSILDLSPDLSVPVLESALVSNKDTLLLSFNEGLEIASVTPSAFSLSDGTLIVSASALAPDYNNVIIGLGASLDSGKIIQLSVNQINDCSGNTMQVEQTASIALAESSNKEDVVINEILFNPRSGGVDFVELYNRSERILSIANWEFANYAGDSISSKKNVGETPILFLPKNIFGVHRRR